MAVRLEGVLVRADDELLQELVGRPAVRLLGRLDPELTRPKRLRELSLALRSPEALLRDDEARSRILQLLPRAEAEDLAGRLDRSAGDPYAVLRDMRVRRGSAIEALLFAYFGLSPDDSGASGEGAPASTSVSPSYALFPHQRKAIRDVRRALSERPRRVVLHMPTGAGKTRTAMHAVADALVAAEPGLVVWLAYSEELCEQAAGEFIGAWGHLGDRELQLIRFWGDHDPELSEIRDGMVVASLGKLYARAQRDHYLLATLGDRAALVIIDEAHQAIAETYRYLLEVLVDRDPDGRLLGLTATPGRTWNDPDVDRELAEFFARKKVTLAVAGYESPIDYLIEEGYLARPRFEALHYDPATELTEQQRAAVASSLDVPPAALRVLADDEQRNMIIVDAVEALVDRGHRRILVFAAAAEHARLLATVLRVRGISADAVIAQTAPEERRTIVRRYQDDDETPRVLVNYGVLTAGFDAPRTSAAVIARPTKSLVLYSQMVGRATRGLRAGGNAKADVLTVVDRQLPGFRDLSEAFSNWEDVWDDESP